MPAPDGEVAVAPRTRGEIDSRRQVGGAGDVLEAGEAIRGEDATVVLEPPLGFKRVPEESSMRRADRSAATTAEGNKRASRQRTEAGRRGGAAPFERSLKRGLQYEAMPPSRPNAGLNQSRATYSDDPAPLPIPSTVRV